jgi:hypothetical protein
VLVGVLVTVAVTVGVGVGQIPKSTTTNESTPPVLTTLFFLAHKLKLGFGGKTLPVTNEPLQLIYE